MSTVDLSYARCNPEATLRSIPFCELPRKLQLLFAIHCLRDVESLGFVIVQKSPWMSTLTARRSLPFVQGSLASFWESSSRGLIYIRDETESVKRSIPMWKLSCSTNMSPTARMIVSSNMPQFAPITFQNAIQIFLICWIIFLKIMIA